MTPAVLAITVGAVIALGACSGTTYDATIGTPADTAVATTTTLPVGDAATLLPLLVAEARTVGPLIGDGGDHRAAVERINALWSAVKQEIGRTKPELLGTFEAQLRLLDSATRYQRAADADKAYRNLDVLVEAHFG